MHKSSVYVHPDRWSVNRPSVTFLNRLSVFSSSMAIAVPVPVAISISISISIGMGLAIGSSISIGVAVGPFMALFL